MLTVRQVAQVANVGTGTVSRYMNGCELKSQTKEKIEKAIEQIEGKVKRNLNIGVIVPVLNSSFSGQLLQELQQVFGKSKHKMIVICCVDLDADWEYILSLELDGIILHPPHKGCDDTIGKIAKNIPMVLIDMKLDNPLCDQILTDNVNAVYHAVETLIQNNHTEIGLVVSENAMIMAQERYDGYVRVLSDYGIKLNENFIINGDSAKTVEADLNRLRECGALPTALVATNDDVSMNCLIAFMNCKMQMPEDISFIAFDDFNIRQLYYIKPYAVIQPMQEIAQESFNLLLKRICGDITNFPTTKRLKTKMKLGNTVKKI